MLARRFVLVLALLAAGSAARAQQPGKPPPLPPINPATARLAQTIEGLDGPGFAIVAGDAAGVLAAACEEGTIQLWGRDVLMNVRHGNGTPNVLRGHRGAVTCLAYSGGPILASAGVDGKVLLWSLADGRPLYTLATGAIIRALAMSPDGKLVAAAGDDPTIRLCETDTGKEIARLSGHSDWVLGLAFSPDGKLLASAGYDGVVRLWEVPGGKKVREMRGAPPPPPKTEPEPVIVTALAFNPDGKELAVGTAAGVIHLLAVADGKVLRSLTGHTSAVSGLQYHPGGTVLASAGKDRTVRLWNPANAQPFKVLEGHDAWVQGVTFVAQGTGLASVGADRTVRLWDLAAPTK
jgi:WD40 repeat protein